jgi:adenylate cyclase
MVHARRIHPTEMKTEDAREAPWGTEGRRLAAILSADVCGFATLVERDEAGTRAALSIAKRAIARSVEAFGGRIVDAVGDNVLAEFPSAVDAVRAALEIQRRPWDDPRMQREALQFRIGINIGDVAVEGSQIFGDGINVAARLQALARPGGIAVSANIVEQVENKIPVSFDCVGRVRLKNISAPKAVYRVSNGSAIRRSAIFRWDIISRLWANNPASFIGGVIITSILLALLLLAIDIHSDLNATADR